MTDLTELELQVMDIDKRLCPIATRPLNFNDLNWTMLLAKTQSPLHEADIRAETEVLIQALAAEYENSGEETRREIRRLFARYQHFAWAAPFSIPLDGDFRRQLILFSMLDQGKDGRDALLTLRALCEQARAIGIDPAPILREVAQLSSEENKYGMGSTKRMLNNA
jgi:hypothetical protein